MLSRCYVLPQVVAEPLVRGRKNLNVESDSKWFNSTSISS